MFLPMDASERRQLVETAMGRRSPSLVLSGAEVLNVYTGRTERADVAVAGRWIAYVGDLEEARIRPGEDTRVLDVSGRVLVPGYIEVHAHPFQLYNPVTLAEHVLPLGTTVLISDNLFLFTRMEETAMLRLWEELSRLPVKYGWWARLDPQSHLPESLAHLFDDHRVRRVLHHPLVLQAGELSDWMPLLEGDERMQGWIGAAHEWNKRVEGHAPGASHRTLARLAAAGVTGDHESISPDEVWDRLRLGYMVTLRHSSLRPDLPVLMEGLVREKEVPWNRLMMTTDGPTPSYFRHGFVDYLIRTAIDAGCDPVRAYQMVTINPAVYYRMDERIGGIAPGRLADINVLSSLDEPVPLQVIANGELVAVDGQWVKSPPSIEWSRFSAMQRSAPLRVDVRQLQWHVKEGETVPVLNLVNPVITKLTEETITTGPDSVVLPEGDDRLFAYLIDRDGRWITRSLIRGFGQNIDALVSTYNGSGDWLVIGRNIEAMAQAILRASDDGSGITWIQGDETYFHLPLPLLGLMSEWPMERLAEKTEELTEKLKRFGHPFYDPVYTFLFLSSTHLPQARLTADGVLRVKDRTIVYPAERWG
jgi:adenine deaminase